MALTAKRQRFVEEYLVDLNATQAAIRAGYSAKTAMEQGYQLLQISSVADAIEKARAELSKRTEITQDMVLKELARIGFSDIRKAVKWQSNVAVAAPDFMADHIDVDEMMEKGLDAIKPAIANQVELVDSTEIDDDTAAAIAEIAQTDRGGLKVKFHDKRAALVDIGRHLGMFKDGASTVNVNIAPSLAHFYGAASDGGNQPDD